MLFQSISGIRIIWEVSVNTMARHLNSSGILHSLTYAPPCIKSRRIHTVVPLFDEQSSCCRSRVFIL